MRIILRQQPDGTTSTELNNWTPVTPNHAPMG